MSWRYRLCKQVFSTPDEPLWYTVREVYTNPTGWTAPIDFGGETPEQVVKALEMALADVKKDIAENTVLDVTGDP